MTKVDSKSSKEKDRDNNVEVQARFGLRSLDNILDQFLKPIYKNHGYIITKIMLAWPKIIGEDLEYYTKPIKITSEKLHKSKKDSLHIEIYNSYAMERVIYTKDVILEKIKIFTGFEHISDIRTKLIPKNISISKPKNLSDLPLSPEEKEQVDIYLSSVADENIREALKDLVYSLIRRDSLSE